MADETKTQAQAAADAPAKIAQTVAATTTKVVKEATETGKRTRRSVARKAKRASSATPTARKPRAAKATRRNARTTNSTRTARAETAAVQEGIKTVNTNLFTAFNGGQGFAPFQNMFADAGERSQQAARRTQQVAEDMADIARGNVEAMVEASRVAAEGARAIGQDVVARGRQGVEQTADAIRTLAEAKSPTEYLQLQGEIARTSFDRMVAETSRLTESMVKLAGEAMQPLSNRASANAERINAFVA